MHPCRVNRLRADGTRPLLMGVINISPESFYSGSYVRKADILCTAEAMIQQGADLIDIGARSTAPDSPAITVAEETSRVIDALRSLQGSGITISLDTMIPSVLEAALHYDLHLVNDISGLITPGMGSLITDAGLPAILMASRERPGDCLTFAETCSALQEVTRRAEEAGVEEYILDPGVGKWIPDRTAMADFELCRRFTALHAVDRPLLAAVSRKSFIGAVTGKEPAERLSGSLGITASLILSGAAMIRSHDVAETRDLITVISAMQGA